MMLTYYPGFITQVLLFFQDISAAFFFLILLQDSIL